MDATVEHIQPTADQLARVPNLVRSLYKQQRISIPDNAQLDCLYPFEYSRRQQEIAYIMDNLTCPRCGHTTHYADGCAVCRKCGHEYIW